MATIHHLKHVSIFVFLCLTAGWYENALAFKKVEPTPFEYDTWPTYCQAHAADTIPDGRKRPVFGKEDVLILKGIGIWHYCNGLINLNRAEVQADKRTQFFIFNDEAWRDLVWSWNKRSFMFDKLGRSHPLVIKMMVDIARGHRLRGEKEKAKKLLMTAIASDPRYPSAYSVMGIMYFDDKDYEKAVEVLNRGDEATKGESAEINYFLGLAYLNLGDIASAKKHEKIARSLGYPLSGLANKIAQYERARQIESAPDSVPSDTLDQHAEPRLEDSQAAQSDHAGKKQDGSK